MLFAYIFGSFVSLRPFSDIDIGICLDKEPENTMDMEFELENGLEEKLRLPVDVRILNMAPLSFCYNVVKEGKLIVDNDSNKR